jgi:hypothetical protein
MCPPPSTRAAESSGTDASAIAATVDGTPIKLADLDERLAATYRNPRERRPKDARERALSDLIDERLLTATANRLDIRVHPDEVEDAVDRIARRRSISRGQLLEIAAVYFFRRPEA